MTNPPQKISAKQEAFCQQYLIDLNATQAAIRAGYSEKSSNNIGPENLLKPIIQKRIAELQAIRSERTAITQDKVLKEAARLLFSDMRKIATWDGDSVNLEDSTEISDDDAACVESVSQTTTKDGGSISCKLHSKTKALELVMRHLGMLNDKMNLGGQKDNPITSTINPDALSDAEKETIWAAIQKSKEKKCQQQPEKKS
jgi:phage terminase small subunit